MQKPHKEHEQTIVKRGGGKHAHDDHGGAWKVAFADFCLALMCLFLVLWLMAARNTESLQHILTEADGNKTDQGKGVMPEQVGGPRGSLIERFPMPRSGKTDEPGTALGSGADTTEVQDAKVSYETPGDLQKLSKALAKMSVDAGLASNLESVITPYGLRVMLHDTDKQGMFVRGSAVPTDRFRDLLRKMGPLFERMKNQMLVVGHTDSTQYADTGYFAYSNWTLSSNRAMAARSMLLSGGMRKDSVLQVVGMADRAPVDTQRAGAGVNRRIELLILTSQQAQAVSAMFGMPGSSRTLGEIDTALPDAESLEKLRNKLGPEGKYGTGRNDGQ